MNKPGRFRAASAAVLAISLALLAYAGVSPARAQDAWCDERCTSKYGWVHYHWYPDGEVAIHEYQGCSGNILYVKCYYS
jgi:recombinational DNA repair protein (RecF pathway)